MNQQSLNAVRTLAKQCAEQHKASGKRMTNAELKALIAPYREKAKLLGCDAIRFTFEIAVVTGQIRDRA